MTLPTFPGSDTLTAANHKATATYAAQRAWLGDFNNLVIEGRDGRGWVVRASDFAAAGVARDGAFDVTRIAGDRFTVKRRYPHRVVDAAPVATRPAPSGWEKVDVDLSALLASLG